VTVTQFRPDPISGIPINRARPSFGPPLSALTCEPSITALDQSSAPAAFSGSPTAAYQDVTTAYQNLGPNSRGADWVNNTRNDDRAYLRYIVNSTGATKYLCLPPNNHVNFTSAYTVTGIRIDTASSC
jgi:hypothetical protein